jgi:hypothetical protein
LDYIFTWAFLDENIFLERYFIHVTKKSFEYAYEKRRRSARVKHTVVSIAVCLLIAGYLFYSGNLSAAKLHAFLGSRF